MKAIFRILVLGSMLAATPYVSASAEQTVKDEAVAQAAEAARVMTIDELYNMYQGRSWIWDDGAGYFQVSQRRFISWVRSGRNSSYGEGIWFLTERGALCFRAIWYALDGDGEAVTCFEHRTDAKNIYQRRLPDGEWYVFSHLPSRRYDAIRKLKRGDYVSRKFRRNRRYIAEHMLPEDPCASIDPVSRILCQPFRQ